MPFSYQHQRSFKKRNYSRILKKLAFRTLFGFLRGLVFSKKIFSFLFFLVFLVCKPLFRLGKIVLKFIVLKIYKIYLFFKRWFLKIFLPVKSKVFYPLNKRYVFHFTLIFIALLTATTNINAREVRVDSTRIGQKSILFTLVRGDEDQEVVEEGFPENPKVTSYLENEENVQARLSLQEDISPGIPQVVQEGSTLVKPDIISTDQKTRTEIEDYVVRGGDTISTIAEEFGISVDTILWANKLSARSLIRPGDKLTILPATGVAHEVKKGDSLGKIAKYYNTEVEKILEFNKLADVNDIEVGETLVVPDGRIPAPQPSPTRFATIRNFYIPPSAQAPTSSSMFWPTTARRITQYFTWRHHGLDIAGPYGSPVYAASDGVIKFAGWGRGYGNQIDIDHGGGTVTRYAHQSKIFVSKGQKVKKGQAIGAMGSTGWSTGSHLHFEVIKGGAKKNPLSYIR